ncbi:MAG: hypothetical protein H7326_01755, partial [Bdellovibrionaceae bacterium]|nr:hypothetical protein [Pseudobdellovibrionaceae bacterium]
MKNKRLSLSLFGIVLSGIIIFGGRKYYEPSVSEQAAEDMEVGEKLQEKSLYDAVVISTKNDALENVPSAIACTDLQKIKSATAADADHFWEIPNSKGDFIVYDKKSKVITACYEGKAASAKLPPEMATEGEDQVIRVSPAFFTDLFADGKREFLIFSGQCVEGPCIGSHYLYQVDGAELRKLYKFRSDTVELITEKERRALILDNNCYTYDFGVGFE